MFFTTRNDETLQLKREERVTWENVDILKEIDDERKAAGFHGMPVFVWNAVNAIVNVSDLPSLMVYHISYYLPAG